MQIDAELTSIVQRATTEVAECDYRTGLERVVAAVLNVYPNVTASEALAAVREVWARSSGN